MIRQESYQLEGNPLIHDFVVAGSYLVFFIAPVEIAMWPVLLGMSSFCEAMHWRDEKASQILIFERENLTLVARGTTDAWFAWHFANGCQTKDGNLLIEVCRYSNFKTNQFLKEVATGSTNTLAKSELWQIVLNPLTAKVISDKKILSRHCEFPIVPPKLIGQPWQLTYLSLNHEEVQQGNELLSTIGSYDRNRDELQLAPIPKDSYACEPIYVLNKSDYRSSWLVTIVYNGLLQTSEVQIFKASNLKFGPLCRLELPQIIPPSFHGTWKES
jgi:carotenoid cleavage dioxygenase-like enzyme